MPGIRESSHAGSWYLDNKSNLHEQLSNWLNQVPETTEDNVKYPIKCNNAIISPHAGYSYSGRTAAYAFRSVDSNKFNRVFILGPSHHVYMKNCAVTNFSFYHTPLGQLKIDEEVNRELKATGKFSVMSSETDEEEHSIEMQLPYLYKIFESRIEEVTFIPILVGSLSFADEKKYGEVFSSYLKDPSTLFVISSDFCHWGSRFGYTFYSDSPIPSEKPGDCKAVKMTIPLHKSIENLDREGMDKICTCDARAFKDYLNKTENTICGRHPIGVLMATIEHLYPKETRHSSNEDKHSSSLPAIFFNHYSQSSQITQPNDSSVSYAAGYLYNPIIGV